VGEEVATPRLRRSTRTARGGQSRPFYGDLSGTGYNGAHRSPGGVGAAATTPIHSRMEKIYGNLRKPAHSRTLTFYG
jgi:hypothetical protein